MVMGIKTFQNDALRFGFFFFFFFPNGMFKWSKPYL